MLSPGDMYRILVMLNVFNFDYHIKGNAHGGFVFGRDPNRGGSRALVGILHAQPTSARIAFITL